jgi:hypothetical protein
VRDGQVVYNEGDDAAHVARRRVERRVVLRAQRLGAHALRPTRGRVHADELHEAQVLPLAVVVKLEVVELEVGDDAVVPVGDDHVSLHQLGGNADDLFVLRRLLRPLRSGRGGLRGRARREDAGRE